MIRGPVKRVAFIIDDREHSLDAEQMAKLNDWLARVADTADARHRQSGYGFLVDHFKAKGEVYTGASGGNLTYSITPTSLGTAFKVHDAISGETLDLTDYENW